jgi:hypothetical protein
VANSAAVRAIKGYVETRGKAAEEDPADLSITMKDLKEAARR